MGTLSDWGNKATAAVLKRIVAPMVGKEALCDVLGYIENAGAPTSVTPDFTGQTLLDTTNGNWYRSYGTSSGNWALTGGSSGLNRTVTTTATITAADHDATIFIDNATGFVTTLPAPIAGFRCEIINKTANTSGNHTVVTASSANVIKGNQNSVAGDAGDSGTADDTISFVANQSVAGDRVELRSDGTSWFAYATSRVAAGITFTQAS